MCKAFTAMNMKNGKQHRHITSHGYQALREAYSEAISGEGNPMYGRSPHNKGKPVWYCPEKGIHIYSSSKPTPTATKGMKPSATTRLASCGINNPMAGVSLFDRLSETDINSMKSKRRETYMSKTSEERSLINEARANGYQYTIDGKYYPSKCFAMEQLSVSYKQLQDRCKSEKHPTWKMEPRDSKYIKENM